MFFGGVEVDHILDDKEAVGVLACLLNELDLGGIEFFGICEEDQGVSLGDVLPSDFFVRIPETADAGGVDQDNAALEEFGGVGDIDT